jgi:hypothetical protein
MKICTQEMQASKNLCMVWCLFLAGISSQAEGTFQNRGFEQAMIVPVPGNQWLVEFDSALPGWRGYYGTNPVTEASFNSITLSAPELAGTNRSPKRARR